LIIWGKNDKIFISPGAEAYKKDLRAAEVHLLNGGHFLLEEHHAAAARLIDRFLTKLTVPSISKAANIPERTLSRLFKQETGMTIFQFIKTGRMQKALELMEDPSMNISEIVYYIGYESTATFSNLFKQLVGISPQKYRQRFLLLA
jgi:AraC-like DNA-binding protein